MKRLFVILFLIPSLAFGTYTEFYCQNGGSNLNAGSTTNNTAAYTSAGGNWVQSTRVFTVTDGTNPSSSVNVGDIGSVYVTAGATATGFFGRISAVQNATNGTVTFAAGAFAGASPANGTGTLTLKVGGAWKGPNAGVSFPTSLQNVANANDGTNRVRINFKNDQTYSMTSPWTASGTGGGYVLQGYTGSTGDGGKATVDGGTSTAQVVSTTVQKAFWIDFVFKTSITTTTNDLVATNLNNATWQRCIFTGARGNGLATGASSSIIECEIYDCNKSNTSGKSGVVLNSSAMLRTVVHDCAGSNTDGVLITATPSTVQNCILDTNGKSGVNVVLTGDTALILIDGNDFYNNGADAITNTNGSNLLIENNNFIKNTGAGINNATTFAAGYIYNCGYGSGTQANGSADTVNNLQQSGTVTYASDVTPWVDPANGDFRINLDTAEGAGRGAFTQTAASYTGSVGYPDIGAVQAQIGTAFPTPTATATATPTPTATATATATVTPTVTPTPTAPIEQSYVYPN